MLIGCLFGISFICIGNMASNCIICALRILQAAHPEKEANSFSNGTIRGIAIAIGVSACFIHTFTRRGGIVLNDALAVVKLLILLFIIATACAVAAGGIHNDSSSSTVPNVIGDNTSTAKAFAEASHDSNAYAQAFLAISDCLFTRRINSCYLTRASVRLRGLRPGKLCESPQRGGPIS